MTKITNTYVLDKAKMSVLLLIMLFTCPLAFAQSVWGIERSGFFNGREKWAKGFENQRV